LPKLSPQGYEVMPSGRLTALPGDAAAAPPSARKGTRRRLISLPPYHLSPLQREWLEYRGRGGEEAYERPETRELTVSIDDSSARGCYARGIADDLKLKLVGEW
jgi:hypothetical protein